MASKAVECIHPPDMKYELTSDHARELADKWLQTKRAREFRAMPFCCFLWAIHLRAEKANAVKRLKKSGEEV